MQGGGNIKLEPRGAARDRLTRNGDGLIDLSHRIHSTLELAFEETLASRWTAEVLAAAGFSVDAGISGFPTAFCAKAGSGPLKVALLAEYDALPDVGHACGHNMIAAMSAGAAIAASTLADDIGLTLQVFGTPAEERGGGKILLLDRGAFAGVHTAMMVHPAPKDVIRPQLLAMREFEVQSKANQLTLPHTPSAE